MTTEQLDQWTKKLGEAWTALNVEAALALVDRDKVEWFESPFSPALTSWQQVYDTWQHDLSQQKDVSFSHTVLVSDKKQGVVRWQAQLTRTTNNQKVIMDGIFLIGLNEKGLCTNFMMWIETKD
jgi:hypothetical protein